MTAYTGKSDVRYIRDNSDTDANDDKLWNTEYTGSRQDIKRTRISIEYKEEKMQGQRRSTAAGKIKNEL